MITAGVALTGILLGGGASITQIVNVIQSFTAEAILNAMVEFKNECITVVQTSQNVSLACKNPGAFYMECLKRVADGGNATVESCRGLTEEGFLSAIEALCTGGDIVQTATVRVQTECMFDITDDIEAFKTMFETQMQAMIDAFESFDFDAILEQVSEQVSAIEAPKLNWWEQMTGVQKTQIVNLAQSHIREVRAFLNVSFLNSCIHSLTALQSIAIDSVGFDSITQTMAADSVLRVYTGSAPENVYRKERELAQSIEDLRKEIDAFRSDIEADQKKKNRTIAWIVGGIVVGFVVLAWILWTFRSDPETRLDEMIRTRVRSKGSS